MRYEQLSDRIKAALAQADAAVAGVVPFIANLYDPKTGGFYFTMSGKNDPDMEPGLEMTAWGIMIVKGQMAIWDDMPKEVREKFVQFFHDRQDPMTGFYIDKQGPANDRETARIQNATLKTLRYFPAEPRYPHPINVKEPTSQQTANVPAYMETVESYLEWVNSLPWAKESWAAGDKVQASQIFVKTLPEDKQAQYVNALINWFETHQNPETGLWAEEIDFNSISGAFKNGLTYDIWGLQLPHVDEIIDSTIRCYQTHQADKPFYVRNPLSLLRQIAGYSEEFQKKVQDTVLDHIELMMENFSWNKCPDGGYSASYQKSNPSFGGVVGSHELFEGDSNATLMILLAREELYNIFEVTAPPLKADHFWDWITEKEEMPSPYQNSFVRFGGSPMLMPKVKDPEFWKQVRTDPDYEPIVQQIKEYYDYAYMKEIPELTYYSRARYHIDGDRNEFQIPYFRRRQFLASAALLGMIYPEEQHYLDEVHEVIWAICDEYSWVLPAHGKGTLEWDLTHVDLFNAETGFALAELCYILEDRLDPLVLNRARTEVRRRVFDNFLNETFEWETKTNNWAAVCAGCIGGAMMYLEPELFKEQLPRLLSAMGYFMKSFPEDGTCMEGFHYWHYGFGNFVWFADLLLQFTNGEVNLFTWDKVEAVSGYAQRCVLRGGTTVSYSDGERKGKSDRAMMHYLSRLFPKQVQLIPDEYTEFFKGNVTWMQTLRNLVYVDYTAKPVAFQLKDYDLPGAGQVVINRGKYSLAVKAGHNAEAHNHNDVGNFILATDKGQIFCDLGAGLYTKQYFRDRYSVFCNASRGHNVPIINGGEQMTGSEYGGTLTHEGNTIRMEFAGAYGQPEVTKLTRTFTYEDQRIVLTDAFDPNYQSFKERFITTFRPVVHPGYVEINGVELCFDAEKVQVSIQEVVHALHGYFEGTEIVYCIDFELNPGLEEITFTMKL